MEAIQSSEDTEKLILALPIVPEIGSRLTGSTDRSQIDAQRKISPTPDPWGLFRAATKIVINPARRY